MTDCYHARLLTNRSTPRIHWKKNPQSGLYLYSSWCRTRGCHINNRDSVLVILGWDLLCLTHIPNLKCLRLLATKKWKATPNVKILVLSHPLEDLGKRAGFIYGSFVGKRVVDFLLVLINFYCRLSRLRRYERVLTEIVVFEKVTLSAHLRGKGVVHQRCLASKNSSFWAITGRFLRDTMFSHFDAVPACDRQTDRQTDRHTTTANTRTELARACRNPKVCWQCKPFDCS